MKRLALAAALAATTASPLLAFDMSAMSEDERTAFRAEIRAYLMENPEVLLEAINVLEQRQAAQQVEGDRELVRVNGDEIFEDPDSWVGGNPEGDITVVEFLDYQCGYCKRAHPEVKELLSVDGNIRYIVKEFPILGDASVLASRFAIAVLREAGGEAYRQVNDALMTMRGQVNVVSLEGIAGDLGLDVDGIMTAMQDPDIDRVIAENRALAQRLQINGTPSFIFQTEMLRGYVPLDGMLEVVAGIRSEG